MGSEENPCADDGRGTGGTRLLKADIINRKAPLSEDYQTEVTRPSWRAPVHVGDRIRITGYYANKKHAWYTAMTHNGFYIDETPPPKGHCKPYLVGKDSKKRIRRKVKTRAAPPGSSRPGSTRPRAFPTASGATTTTRSAASSSASTRASRRSTRPRPGPHASRVLIANFQYMPGGRTAPGAQALPPTVKQGDSITFVNVDQQANIRHSVTTCKYPCNGRYVSNYPWADGRWDSGTLGYDAIDGGTPDPVSSTPTDLPVGKYSYFCRIHPFMRGEFRVVP